MISTSTSTISATVAPPIYRGIGQRRVGRDRAAHSHQRPGEPAPASWRRAPVDPAPSTCRVGSSNFSGAPLRSGCRNRAASHPFIIGPLTDVCRHSLRMTALPPLTNASITLTWMARGRRRSDPVIARPSRLGGDTRPRAGSSRRGHAGLAPRRRIDAPQMRPVVCRASISTGTDTLPPPLPWASRPLPVSRQPHSVAGRGLELPRAATLCTGVLRPAERWPDRTDLDQPPQVHDRDGRDKLRQQCQIVSDEEQCEILFPLQMLEKFDDLSLNGDIESARWFVADQQQRRHREGPCDTHALSLAT